MLDPPNNHDLNTKISTLDNDKTDRGVFEERDDFFYYNMKNLPFFGQEKRSIFILGQGKATPLQHFCQGKRVDF